MYERVIDNRICVDFEEVNAIILHYGSIDDIYHPIRYLQRIINNPGSNPPRIYILPIYLNTIKEQFESVDRNIPIEDCYQDYY